MDSPGFSTLKEELWQHRLNAEQNRTAFEEAELGFFVKTPRHLRRPTWLRFYAPDKETKCQKRKRC